MKIDIRPDLRCFCNEIIAHSSSPSNVSRRHDVVEKIHFSIIGGDLMSNTPEWDFMNEKATSHSPEKSKITLDYAFGILCFFLLMPTLLLAFGEFMDTIDFIEYGADIWDFVSWFLYTTTIFSILLISGFHFTGVLKSESARIGSGVFLITISIVNLISRFYDFREQRGNWGISGESWLEFLYWPSTHERLELVFLGVIIGFLIIKK